MNYVKTISQHSETAFQTPGHNRGMTTLGGRPPMSVHSFLAEMLMCQNVPAPCPPDGTRPKTFFLNIKTTLDCMQNSHVFLCFSQGNSN